MFFRKKKKAAPEPGEAPDPGTSRSQPPLSDSQLSRSPRPESHTDGIPTGEINLPDLTKTVELVRQVQGGDSEALNEIFRRYFPRLRRVVRIKMGSQMRQHLDPEDIVQETLMVAMDKLSAIEVRSQASVMQWLTKVAENQIRNKLSYIKAQKRDPNRERRLQTGESSGDLTSSGVVVPHQGPTPSQILSRAELEELIDSCMEELDPPDYREVILLRDYYGADWEAIREQLGRPSVDAARELHRRAHDKLQQKLAKRGWS